MKKTVLVLVFLLSLGGLAAAQDFKRDVQVGIGYAYTFSDSFGGLKSAYVPSVVYNFHISNDFLIGIVLGRFQDNA